MVNAAGPVSLAQDLPATANDTSSFQHFGPYRAMTRESMPRGLIGWRARIVQRTLIAGH